MQRSGGAPRWAAALGLPLPRRERWTAQTIAAALEPLLAGRRTWPNRREFDAAGLGGLYAAITNTEGHPAVASRYGLALQRPGRRRALPRHQRAPTRPRRTNAGV